MNHTKHHNHASAFEATLPLSQRKELGQFFTGMPLGRILAFLAINSETRYIIDPMVGSGDLLNAVCEATAAENIIPEQVDGIEIDSTTAAFCEERLKHTSGLKNAPFRIICEDAFKHNTYKKLSERKYDLVITNPPYVRYQLLKERRDNVRSELIETIEYHLTDISQDIWSILAKNYSGLADLSVPAWLLSALLVRPGGYLALVVPATWRSRAYADVIRYLLLRCFKLEIVIEDTQPGWFSSALVRTHLIVAKRLTDEEISEPLNVRTQWSTTRWIQVEPNAASSFSLIGNAFREEKPEIAFAHWCRSDGYSKVQGINPYVFSLKDEWDAVYQQANDRPWFQKLEQNKTSLPLFAQVHSSAKAIIPNSLRNILPKNLDIANLCTLEDLGVCVGQGLRTGCNRFFYVQIDEDNIGDLASVKVDSTLGGGVIQVPQNALRPVLHRQVDTKDWHIDTQLSTRVLDLRHWILPEDNDIVYTYINNYRKAGESLPKIMPDSLAKYVRDAGNTTLGNLKDAKPISEMTAVKTNIRKPYRGATPRFWYMLPDFMPRHLPQAFVPRIIHKTPKVLENTVPPKLIDANFATFWTTSEIWSIAGLVGLLNSSWCQAVMETMGTPLGGGALKLEAIHLRKIPVPFIDPSVIKKLDGVGQQLDLSEKKLTIDSIVLNTLFSKRVSNSTVKNITFQLDQFREASCTARQRNTA